jgi:hypothetical protein
MNPKITRPFDIAESFARFKQCKANLPPHTLLERSPIIHNLDALFDMVFVALSKHARNLLSVLALLAPGNY